MKIEIVAIYLDLTLSLVYMSQKIVIFAMAYAVRHLPDVGHWVGHFYMRAFIGALFLTTKNFATSLEKVGNEATVDAFGYGYFTLSGVLSALCFGVSYIVRRRLCVLLVRLSRAMRRPLVVGRVTSTGPTLFCLTKKESHQGIDDSRE
ncbi:MAG: hypothetical protein K2I37_00980 [Muribaculaceae bacterium]|nr:hypothetical protein [Muribaculaceae bacterium]